MPPSLRRARTAAAIGAASLALIAFGFSPAGAEPPAHAASHEHRPAQAGNGGHQTGQSAPTVTEDTDSNDGNTPNNVVDDGDNMHPSGKDRSLENGRSSNQGNAGSDPDDDGRGPDRSNGGADQPDGSGGDDLADQDGNNGCGNDDDFEDDNEGLCLGRDGAPGQQPDEDVEVDEDVDEDVDLDDNPDVDTGTDAEVKGDVVTRPGPSMNLGVLPVSIQPAMAQPVDAAQRAQVLGSQVTRNPSALAATGDNLTYLAPVGLGLVLLGAGMHRKSKRVAAAGTR